MRLNTARLTLRPFAAEDALALLNTYSRHVRISLAGLLGYGFVAKSRRSPATPSIPLRALTQNPSQFFLHSCFGFV